MTLRSDYIFYICSSPLILPAYTAKGVSRDVSHKQKKEKNDDRYPLK